MNSNCNVFEFAQH